MATITHARSVNATLSGTTVDLVEITAAEGNVLVVNRDATNTVWVTYSLDGSTPADPVAEDEGTYPIAPGWGFLSIESSQVGQSTARVKVLGNGGAYTVTTGQVTGSGNCIELGIAAASAGGGGGAVTATGNVAHDAADSGNPVKVGGKAATANPTAVADADRVDVMADDLGKLVVVPTVRDLDVQQTTTITSSTSETTILTAGAAGVFHDVYSILITNTSATASEVTVRDVTAGGTTRSFMVPAGQTVGATLTAPWRQGTAASAWTAQCGTSVASVKVYVAATKNI